MPEHGEAYQMIPAASLLGADGSRSQIGPPFVAVLGNASRQRPADTDQDLGSTRVARMAGVVGPVPLSLLLPALHRGDLGVPPAVSGGLPAVRRGWPR